jgi:glycosyltransferase involved in cell wall biosynthesis
MIRVGVTVPTLNGATTLPWTLLSLRRQVQCAAEVVVADSGSSDETLAVSDAMGIRSIYVPPGNMYQAVNVGLRSLDCDWLTYLNADDVAYTDAYATLVDAGERSGADVVYGDCDYIDWHGRFLFSMRAASPFLLRGMFRAGVIPFSQPCAIFRRSLFEEIGGFDEGYRLMGDFDFFSRAAMSGARFEQVRGFSVTAFRLHESQLSSRSQLQMREELDRYLTSQPRPLSARDRLAVWRWQLKNTSNYLLRRLRTGQWSGRPQPRG